MTRSGRVLRRRARRPHRSLTRTDRGHPVRQRAQPAQLRRRVISIGSSRCALKADRMSAIRLSWITNSRSGLISTAISLSTEPRSEILAMRSLVVGPGRVPGEYRRASVNPNPIRLEHPQPFSSLRVFCIYAESFDELQKRRPAVGVFPAQAATALLFRPSKPLPWLIACPVAWGQVPSF